MNNESGFTLLELLLVMLIISLIIGLTAVFIGNSVSKGNLNATARDITSAIRYARTLARTDGGEQAVTLDLDAKQYGIEGRTAKKIPAEVDIVVDDPFTGKVRSGTYRFLFSPLGTSEGGTITLSSKKKTVSIVMDPIMGAAAIK